MADVSVPDSVSMPPPPPPRSVPIRGFITNSNSPPPNCAICLGSCTNKSFSDSCMHQFCFTCLLEWSKIKPECPLCKQPFTTIIHNVKSNSEYDEHYVQQARQQQEVPNQINDVLFLPSGQPPSRHFQFRTTFTVDPRGEFAIQQMLLTHPLTNSISYVPHYVPERYRRLISSTNFRRFIYDENLWVSRTADVTGRFREASPRFFREHPGAINRLAPWLNRELNALLAGNTQQIMHLIDTIMEHLHRHHIIGSFFKNLLSEYLGPRTEHFIHEFYNFMRSPYDMVGYDRHSCYTSFPQPVLSDENISSDDDSDDVAILATTSAEPAGTAPNAATAVNPFHRPTIEVIEINSDSSNDSDVIIQEPTPVIVDLLNSSDDDVLPVYPETEDKQQEPPQPSTSTNAPKISIIDVKIKKRKRKMKMRELKRREKRRGKGIYTSSSDSSSSVTDIEELRRRKKKYIKKMKKYQSSSSSSSSSSTSSSSSSTSIMSTSTTSTSSTSTATASSDDSGIKSKSIKSKGKTKSKKRKLLTINESDLRPSSTTAAILKKEYCEATTNTDHWANEPQSQSVPPMEVAPLDYSMANFARSFSNEESRYEPPRYDEPSCSTTKVEPLKIKREYNLWFRPSYDRNGLSNKYDSDDSDCDD